MRELQSIADYGLVGAIDPVFTPTASSYWSSTTYAPDPSDAWYVGFNVGYVSAFPKDGHLFVRAVRGGPK
ncbi:MAG: DUF1566 domain-containing protein [Deltaproteobacteria bacterium]|nr:DUF1566 domain-containing protein [Deltaproteobacteria bacterium]